MIADYAATWAAVNSNIIQLWAMFTAGNFAACAFSISVKALGQAEKWAMTVGYWLFALGNLTLIVQNLLVLLSMKDALPPAVDGSIAPILADMTNPVWYSVVFHLFVCLCVTAIIWRSAFPGRQNDDQLEGT